MPIEHSRDALANTQANAIDAIDDALASALTKANVAGRWDVVAQLARELEARRLARAGNVVSLDHARRDRGAPR